MNCFETLDRFSTTQNSIEAKQTPMRDEWHGRTRATTFIVLSTSVLPAHHFADDDSLEKHEHAQHAPQMHLVRIICIEAKISVMVWKLGAVGQCYWGCLETYKDSSRSKKIAITFLVAVITRYYNMTCLSYIYFFTSRR